jgi:hypothetical protein
VLGLKPGAARAEVDEAYRRLIKRHHPDRTGGDAQKAAEINRAYTQIRRKIPGPVRPRAVAVPVPRPKRRPRRGRATFLIGSAILIAGFTALAGVTPRNPVFTASYQALPWAMAENETEASAMPLTDFGEPLQTGIIDQAVADAIRFHSTGDDQGSVDYSRSCLNSLRDQQTLAWFDACAAFDEATVVLDSDTELADSNPFSESAVIARQLTAARMLTDDTLSAESRLHQIRSRVELELVPVMSAKANSQQRQKSQDQQKSQDEQDSQNQQDQF